MAFIIVFGLLYFLFPYIAYREMRYGRSLEPDAEEEHVTHGVVRRQGRSLMTWSLVAAGVAVLSVVLMGLPGGLLLELYRALGITQRAMDIDQVWPAAIYASVLWPISIPAGHYLRQRFVRHHPERRYYWITPLVIIVWIFAVGFILRLAVGG